MNNEICRCNGCTMGERRMKRSEMIERLACFLSEEQGCRKVSSYAEMIIEFLEGEGMQPPKVEKWEEISGTFLGEGFKVMKIVSEWEPEDEAQ